MVTNIIGLRSTNAGGVKQIHFTIINDENPCNAKCKCTICSSVSQCEFPLSANKTAEKSCDHNQSGLCTVVVVETESGKSTQMLLDLDAASSP